jgi:hypothetical protein
LSIVLSIRQRPIGPHAVKSSIKYGSQHSW